MNDKQNPNESDEKNLDEFLDKVHKKEVKIRKISKQVPLEQKEQMGNAIASRLSEYVDSYILIGYDTNDDSLALVSCESEKEKRALANLLDDFIETSNFFPSE